MGARHSKKGSTVNTIYFGGGTPSLLSPVAIETILTAISKQFFIEAPEITIETNPGTVNLEKLKGYRDAGVNRLSIGVQSLNDGLL
ncbi:MAG: coproporphyrinogen oxidase, partial [Deltaproteobacteria bacterium]|nr:coproporphyrinogen oxidase [Deltaproteobacteria bacterium]